MKQFITIIAAILISASAFAQSFNFERLAGPQLGAPGTKYGVSNFRVCDNGDMVSFGKLVYHSTDGGATWRGSSSYSPQLNGAAIHHITSNGVLLAGISSISINVDSVDGIYRSSDYGNTWKKVFSTEFPTITSFSSSKQGVCFAVTSSDPNNQTCSILRSEDEGVTWTTLKTNHAWIGNIQFDDANNVYFVSGSEDAVVNDYAVSIFKTDINFSQEVKFDNGISNDPSRLFKFSVMPNNSFLVSDQSTADQSTLYSGDASGKWKVISDSIFPIVQITSTKNGILWATQLTEIGGSNYYFLLIRSTDNGVSWDESTTFPVPVLNPINFGAEPIAAPLLFRGSDNSLYVNSLRDAEYVTTDDGATWKSVAVPAASITGIAIDSAGVLFAQTEFNDIFISFNNGKTWVKDDPDLPEEIGGAIGAGPNGEVLATTFLDNTCGGKNVWRFDDAEIDKWEELSPIATGFAANFIVTDHNNNSFIGVDREGVYRSQDGGITWELIPLPNTGVDFYSMAVAPDNTLYAGSDPGIYASIDEGDSWHSINHTFANTIITSLAVPTNGTIVAGTSTKGLYKSTDNGSSWNHWGNFTDSITCLISLKDGTVLAGTSKGLFACNSTGNNWIQQSFGNEIIAITSMAVQRNGQTLLIGTTGGVWKTVLDLNAVASSFESNGITISPNPASAFTSITFPAEAGQRIIIELLDDLGRTVRNIQYKSLGSNPKLDLDLTGLSNGIYSMVLKLGSELYSGKIAVLR